MADKETHEKAPRGAARTKAVSRNTLPAPEPVAAAARAPRKRAEPRAKSVHTLTVRQIASPIGREQYQHATLKGLGLGKLNRKRVLEDTPSVRGMIAGVKHLVRIETDA